MGLITCWSNTCIAQGNACIQLVTDRPVLPQPYQGSYRGRTKRGLLTPKSEVRLGVWKVPTVCPLWEEKGATVLEGGQGSS